MASPSEISVSELVEHYQLEERVLDLEVTSDRFHEMCHSLSQWRRLAPILNVEEAVENIENDYRGNEEMKKNAFLTAWKHKYAMRATYRRLIAALLSIERAEDARKICQLLSDLSPAILPSLQQSRPSNVPSVAVASLSLLDSGLDKQIKILEKKFEDLVEEIEDSFIERKIPLIKIQRYIKHIPVSRKLELGEYFSEQIFKIFKAKSLLELFAILSFFWDYLNPGLLEVIVGKFGSDADIKRMNSYSKELKAFRRQVKLSNFVHAHHRESQACSHYFYKRITTIMGGNWEEKTLQDAEEYRIELSQRNYYQMFMPQMHVQESSIAIVFSIPHWLQINLEELEPFFRRNEVIRVLFNDFCVIDWIHGEPKSGKHLSLKPFHHEAMLGKFKYPAVPSSSTPEYRADPLPVSELKKMHIKALLLLVALIKKQAFYFLYSCHRDLKKWEQFLSGKSSKAFENMKNEMKTIQEKFLSGKMKDKMKTIQEKKHFSRIDFENIIREVKIISSDLIDLESHHEKSSAIINRQVMKIEQIQEEIFGLIDECYDNEFLHYSHGFCHFFHMAFPDYIDGMRKKFLYKIKHKYLTMMRSDLQLENSLISEIHHVMSSKEDHEEFEFTMHYLVAKRWQGEGIQIDTSTIFNYQQGLVEMLHTVATEQALAIFCLTTYLYPDLSEIESFEIAESLMELAEVVDKFIMIMTK